MAFSPKGFKEIVSFEINTSLCQSEILYLKRPQVNPFNETQTILKQKNQGKDTLALNETAPHRPRGAKLFVHDPWKFANLDGSGVGGAIFELTKIG